MSALCHVWTAPSWQGFSSRLRAGRCSHVFGLLARHTGAAGHNALRGSGPGQNLAFDNALAHVGCPDRRIDRLLITCCSPSQPSHRAGVGTISLRRECDGFLVALTLGHHSPRHPRDLISERDRGDLRWPPRQQCREPGPMFRAMDLGIADDGQRARREQAAQIAISLLADTAELVLTPARGCLGTSPIQAEKFRPDRKAFGSATLATRAVASAGPTPGISSSRLLVSLDRCQALIIRSNSKIRALSTRRWAPRAARHARAISGTRLSLGSAMTPSNSSTPLRPTGATIPSSARWARIALITEVCWRMNRWRVRWSIRQLCCSGVLVATKRMFALVTASQMASASAASFFCRLT